MRGTFVEIELPSFEEYDALKEQPAPDGVSVWLPPQGASGNEPITIVHAVVEFSTGVAASVVATWLVKHFQGRKAKKITIERREIILDHGQIQKILEEKITSEEKNN